MTSDASCKLNVQVFLRFFFDYHLGLHYTQTTFLLIGECQAKCYITDNKRSTGFYSRTLIFLYLRSAKKFIRFKFNYWNSLICKKMTNFVEKCIVFYFNAYIIIFVQIIVCFFVQIIIRLENLRQKNKYFIFAWNFIAKEQKWKLPTTEKLKNKWLWFTKE